MLSFREVRAVAGEWYRNAVTANQDSPGLYMGWDGWKSWLLSGLNYPDGDPEDYPEGVAGDFVPDRSAPDEARQLLLGKGIVASEASVEALGLRWLRNLRGSQISYSDLNVLSTGEFFCFSRGGVEKIRMPLAKALKAVAQKAKIIHRALPSTFNQWTRAMSELPTERLEALSDPVVGLLGAVAV